MYNSEISFNSLNQEGGKGGVEGGGNGGRGGEDRVPQQAAQSQSLKIPGLPRGLICGHASSN